MKTYPHYEDEDVRVFLVCNEVVWYRAGRTSLMTHSDKKGYVFFRDSGLLRIQGQETYCTLEEASDKVREESRSCLLFSMKKVAKPVIYIE